MWSRNPTPVATSARPWPSRSRLRRMSVSRVLRTISACSIGHGRRLGRPWNVAGWYQTVLRALPYQKKSTPAPYPLLAFPCRRVLSFENRNTGQLLRTVGRCPNAHRRRRGLHADRAAGGDRDHRGAGGAVAAGRAGCAGGGAADGLSEPPAPDRPGHASSTSTTGTASSSCTTRSTPT